MLEQFTEKAMSILSLTMGGVSIGAITGLAIYFVKQLGKNRKLIAVNKKDIEEAFKSAVLPKTIKLDVSKKIEAPIREGLTSMSVLLESKLQRAIDGDKLILAILSQFSHVNKLPPSVQEAIDDYLSEGVTEEISLEE